MQHVRLGGAFYSEWNNIYVQYLARPTFPHSGQASQSAPRHLQSLIRNTASHFSNTHISPPIWYPMLQNMNHASLPVKTLASFRSRQQQDFKGLPKIYKCSWSMWRSTTPTSEMHSPQASDNHTEIGIGRIRKFIRFTTKSDQDNVRYPFCGPFVVSNWAEDEPEYYDMENVDSAIELSKKRRFLGGDLLF